MLREQSHDQIQQLLPWYQNGTLSSRERVIVEKHLSACETCRLCLAEYGMLSSAVATQTAPSVPVETLAVVLDRLDTVPACAPRRPAWAVALSFLSLMLMLAAVLVLPNAQLEITWSATGTAKLAALAVFRAETSDLPEQALLSLPPENLATRDGFSFRDASVRPGEVYFYWLEVRDQSGGSALAGPITVATGIEWVLAKVASIVTLGIGMLVALRALIGERTDMTGPHSQPAW